MSNPLSRSTRKRSSLSRHDHLVIARSHIHRAEFETVLSHRIAPMGSEIRGRKAVAVHNSSTQPTRNDLFCVRRRSREIHFPNRSDH